MPDRPGEAGGTTGDGDRDGHDVPREAPDDPLAAARGGPPDPRDRLWRHPSELADAPAPARAPAALTAPAPRDLRYAGTTRFWLGALVSGVVGSLATVGLLAAVGALDRSETPGVEVASARTASTATAADNDAARVAGDAADSLVVVRAAHDGGSRTGTGVCVGQGTVLTSDALVGDVEEVTVVARDGEEATASVRGRDPVTDLVLLELDADVAVATVAVDAPTPGDDVYAVGAPARGAAPWVSHGVVASLDAMATHASGTSITGLIETDASASEAAAGGALLDRKGHLVGVVVWPAPGRAGALAVPIDVALEVAAELGRQGWVSRAWIGVRGVDGRAGVEVTKVADGGPAGRAGVRIGDVITRVGAREVTTMNDLLTVVRGAEPGAHTTITVRRGDEVLELDAVLGAKASPGGTAAAVAAADVP